MKRVVRKGVFETNSSSSHSLTIKSNKKSCKKVEKGASFEIRSPLAKAVQMLGLIANAERDFYSTAYYIDEEQENNSVKKGIISKIKETSPETFDGIDTESISTYDLAILITPIISGFGVLTDEYFSGVDDATIMVFYTSETLSRGAVQRFKDKMLEALCKINGWTMEKALEEIDFEAFANIEIKEILKDELTAKEKLEKNMEYNFKFKEEFKRSKSTDIVAFAKEYLIRDCNEFKEQVQWRISCELYFQNGCLNDCDCGFEDYYAIKQALDITYYTSDEDMEKKATEFISNNCKIVAVEKYCGLYLEETGEIL